MTLDHGSLIRLTAGWVAKSDIGAIDTGISTKEALRRGRELLARLRSGEALSGIGTLEEPSIDVLHAACHLIGPRPGSTSHSSPGDAKVLHAAISQADWREPDFDERAELLFNCSLAGWRSARIGGKPGVAAEWMRELNNLGGYPFPGVVELDELLARSPSQGGPDWFTELERVELLICLCNQLRCRLDAVPASVHREAGYFYSLLQTRAGEIGWFDEGMFFLGELALIAGTACRHISRWDDAGDWFLRSEAAFAQTMNSTAEMYRVAYQRLAVTLEKRQADVVLREVPALIGAFQELLMMDEALRCGFLHGSALVEIGRYQEAIDAFEGICREAERQGNVRLLALGHTNLVQPYAALGNCDKAFQASRKAIVLLSEVGDRIGMAKVQWGVGILMRGQNDLASATEAFQLAQTALADLGMRADVAALSLVVADIYLERGLDREATHELLGALPIIDELNMVPEGIAALSLLRQSLRQQEINREALRDLHRYVEKAPR